MIFTSLQGIELNNPEYNNEKNIKQNNYERPDTKQRRTQRKL